MNSWEYLWTRAQKISISSKVKENCFKMQNRWHITLKKISLMYKNSSDVCRKCERHGGSYFHLWWMCNSTKQYWSKIHTEMMHILGYSFRKTPEIYLLSLNVDLFKTQNRTIIWYGTYAARTVFAQYWREKEIPGLDQWIVKLNETMGINSLTKYLRDQNKEEYKTDWEKFRNYLTNCKEMSQTAKFLGESYL